MGKASSTKKVQRAARTGNTRVKRQGATPWSWILAMSVIVVVGLVLIGISRNDRKAPGPGAPPQFGARWLVAYGFDVCGEFLADLKSPTPPQIGLFSQSDGVIHIQPQTSADTGKNATIGRWVTSQPGLSVTSTEIKVDGKTYRNGDKCGSTPAVVQVAVNGTRVNGDPRNIRPKDGEWITFAFLPKGQDIPAPPDFKTKLANALALATAPTTTTTAPASTPTTAGGAATTAPKP